ncbi:YggS family pyridoxal phosphate-dependent enzyme [Staphylospora marina]|uniref:YggS family pyridoxal phosphate-dependent enzyme n=1 Tax=Staphylospora marina TaxID=2490858 RepID=UPI003B968712
MEELLQRKQRVMETIREACRRSGRDPGDVRVIAVTKYVDAETTRNVLDAGLEHIGESRAQDANVKHKILEGRGTWHFIGHLQRNKVKDIIGKFVYVHSLDRWSLAEEIDKRVKAAGVGPVSCFIQVNVSGEQTKFGISPRELEEFARETANLSGIDIAGLMTMAPVVEHPEEARPVFRELRRLRDHLLRLEIPRLRPVHLSMGMSQDYGVAVEEGATWVRLGSVLVGGGKRGG